MSTSDKLQNRVREYRMARGWTQQKLAQRAGISRPGISAIEAQRLVPSAAAALALADVFGCLVEELFSRKERDGRQAEWAWPAQGEQRRFWEAEVAGRLLLYPIDRSVWAPAPHDGVRVGSELVRRPPPTAFARETGPGQTLVIAGCDPASELLAWELLRQSGIRLLVIYRSSRQALELLRQGLVHAAGLHLRGADGEDNREVVRESLGPGYRLLRVAQWEEGIASSPDRKIRTAKSAVGSRVRWIGRETGSGARQCLDELFGGRPAPRRIAPDHRGVAEAVRNGWADAGVCLRLSSEEAGLDFLNVRQEEYDVCFSESLERDPRIKALLNVVQSPQYRSVLADLPGYDSRSTGTVH